MRSGQCVPREALEPRTSASGFGCSVPTPTAQDSSSSRRATAPQTGRSEPGTTLTDYVRMFPTPCARDHRSGKGRKANGHAPQLPEVLGGLVNPTFAEWLMGLPLGWTNPSE